MPQLDFFTFSHQFLLLILCFSGLYYFNLLILFPRIKWFEVEKIFFLRFISFEIYVADRFCLGVITMMINGYWYFLLEHWFRMYQSINNTFLLNVSFDVFETKFSKIEILNTKKLILVSLMSFFIFLFFFKNILVFNAEKLMFIYFCLVISSLIFFTKDYLKLLVKEDCIKLITSLLIMEIRSEEYFIKMKKIAKSLKLYILWKTKNSILLNLRKIKQLKLKNIEI